MIVVQAAATYELILTHIVKLDYETRVSGEVWKTSWDDTFIDYAAWERAGEPEGYVWGTNWSMAYPGLTLVGADVGRHVVVAPDRERVPHDRA